MIDLANKILELQPSDAGFILNELPVDDPQRRCPDISLARKELGWEPEISLSEGLKPTLDWFTDIIND